MNALTEYLLRVCVGGICCAVATTLSGAGAKREITRFTCTCVMILLCFSGIGKINFADMNILEQESIQDSVNDALADQMKLQQEETDRALAKYIEETAIELDCRCKVTVQSTLDEGEYRISMVILAAAGGTANHELQSWIVNIFKIKETQIRWEEAL